MSEKPHKKKQRKPTNGKCEVFVNAHCSYDCPDAELESACNRGDLDASDFGMEYITCKECYYSDDSCNCNDCYMKGKKEYCPKEMKECL